MEIQTLIGRKIEYRNYTCLAFPGTVGVIMGGRTAERGGSHADGITTTKNTATVLFVRVLDEKVGKEKLVEVALDCNTIYFEPQEMVPID